MLLRPPPPPPLLPSPPPPPAVPAGAAGAQQSPLSVLAITWLSTESGCSDTTRQLLWTCGREHDQVSQATQKSRAARPHTSPSIDVGCCSWSELAMPEQQRARIVRGLVRGRASGVRRVARASGARTAAAHPRPVGKAARRARSHRRAPSRLRHERSRALRRRGCS